MKEYFVNLRTTDVDVTSALDLDELHDSIEQEAGDALNTSGLCWDEASGEVTFDLWIYAPSRDEAHATGLAWVSNVKTRRIKCHQS